VRREDLPASLWRMENVGRRVLAVGRRVIQPPSGDDTRGGAAPYRLYHRVGAGVNYALGLAEPLVHPRSRFILVTNGRTGSELLVTLLNSHPDIVCEGEILARRVDAPLRYIAGRAAQARLHGASAYGFKVIGPHVRYIQPLRRPDNFYAEMQAEGVHLIRLRRRDILAHAISSTRAQSSGHWHHYTRADGTDFVAPTLDPVQVLAVMLVSEEAEHHLDGRLAGLDVHEFVYEDDLLGPLEQRRTVDAICADLGLPSAPVASDIIKVTPAHPSLGVANYDEICQLLAATRFRDAIEAERETAPADG